MKVYPEIIIHSKVDAQKILGKGTFEEFALFQIEENKKDIQTACSKVITPNESIQSATITAPGIQPFRLEAIPAAHHGCQYQQVSCRRNLGGIDHKKNTQAHQNRPGQAPAINPARIVSGSITIFADKERVVQCGIIPVVSPYAGVGELQNLLKGSPLIFASHKHTIAGVIIPQTNQ